MWHWEMYAYAEIVMESSFVGAVCPLVLHLPVFFCCVSCIANGGYRDLLRDCVGLLSGPIFVRPNLTANLI